LAFGRREAHQIAEPFSIIPSMGLDQQMWFGTRIWRRIRNRLGMDPAPCRWLHEELIVADRPDHLPVDMESVLTEHGLADTSPALRACSIR
jgi:hypothetical protein